MTCPNIFLLNVCQCFKTRRWKVRSFPDGRKYHYIDAINLGIFEIRLARVCVLRHRAVLHRYFHFVGDRDISVGIATELRPGWSGDRIPVGVTFSVPMQTGPGAHPASYTMGTVSLLGVKRPKRDVDTHLFLAPRLKKE